MRTLASMLLAAGLSINAQAQDAAQMAMDHLNKRGTQVEGYGAEVRFDYNTRLRDSSKSMVYAISHDGKQYLLLCRQDRSFKGGTTQVAEHCYLDGGELGIQDGKFDAQSISSYDIHGKGPLDSVLQREDPLQGMTFRPIGPNERNAASKDAGAIIDELASR